MKSINFILIAVAAVAISAGTAFASVNISGGNDTTGCDSENENEWSIENESVIEICNESEACNEFEVCVNTGENELECNTCLGDVETGDISGSIEFENMLNNADFELSPADWGDIDIELDNYMTGPGSENENDVSIENEYRVEISNEANIRNEIEFRAETGENRISNNTCVGDLSTGDIEYSVEIENVANGSDYDFSDVLPSSSVDISAGNSITGPGSENENEIDIENSSEIYINNDSSIVNEVNVRANTGENIIGNNTCVGDISTGSISIEYTAVNSAN